MTLTLTPVAEVLKDPDALLDYGFDWAPWLEENTPDDTISTSTWVIETGPTLQSPSNTTTTASVWVSGGTLGEDYLLRNRIVTAGGRTEDRTMMLKVRER